MKSGLVLEGGGMRGLYTAGALEYFLDNEIYFPYVIGVSSGASIACSYLSRQKGRNKEVNIGLINDPRFISLKNLWTEKSLFGMNFLFHEVPRNIIPLHIEPFHQNGQQFVIGTTDCKTGSAHYISYPNQDDDLFAAVRASSSLPMLSPIVSYKGFELLDGGVADPIPINKSMKDGNNANIVILTREKGYRKKPFSLGRVARRFYKQYPALVQAMIDRPRKYNETLAYIEKLENDGQVKVLRPSADVRVKRTEKSARKLENIYDAGYKDAGRLHHLHPEWFKIKHNII
ncbi:patatin family protein [Alteribacillus sp. HJP-4]|uniref:patatin-like phospholipase family protein n=1 Tax=Alteribacillus sp. HJP-4 TaxID=2775394 RepID=UPI0035CD07DD